jgi:RNA polymerase sigma-70 factor (ECF subfamily)
VPGEAKPWLLGVARRVVANQRRAAGRRTALRERVAHQPGDGGELETPPIVQALGRLSEGDREVVLLCAWEGLSIEEAATALGCSPTAAKVRLHRARRRLRAELDRLERVPSWPRTRTLEECREE